MDYAYRALRGVKAFYNAINPATLSGAIDVIVVEQPDGEYRSTPFHVRFGKYGVFSHFDKFVDMTINGEEIDVKMKLCDSGVAYFVEECESDDDVPEHMITSPMPECVGNQAIPNTDEVLIESARKLQDGLSISETNVKTDNEPSPKEKKREFLPSFKPFSALTHRRIRSLPDLSAAENKTNSYEVRKTTTDDIPLFRSRSVRRSQQTSKRSLRRSSPTTRNNHIADGALSDSEVDRQRNNSPEPNGNDMTDWKWGEMPDTKENKPKETPRESSGWNWYLWRKPKTTAPPTKKEEGITLDELMADTDPTKVEKYLGKADSRSMSVDDRSTPSPLLTSPSEGPSSIGTTSPRISPVPLNTNGIVPHCQHRPRRQKLQSVSSNEEIFALSEDDLESVEEEDGKCYVRSLRLSSAKLKSLNLVPGANECRFSITTKFQGTCWCTCNIYLYKWDEQIVISDVDGTITKSDVLGHVIPAIGGTWAHSGVADLYTRIKNNGYKMVYLSSRAIGQSHTTKQYLRSIAQDSQQLPNGPVLLSPTSVFLAFRREVIERKPEEFKIAALSDLKKLFPVVQPFFAGFGNRDSDVTSYRAVGIPLTRILIIDPSGKVKRADSTNYVSSYMSMANETVDYLFPPLGANVADPTVSKPEFRRRDNWYEPIEHSSFTYWMNGPTPKSEVADEELQAYEAKRMTKK